MYPPIKRPRDALSRPLEGQETAKRECSFSTESGRLTVEP